MKKMWIIIPALFFVCQNLPEQNPAKLTVAASILPLADFCRHVGGDRVEVLTVVPAGADPHTFSLTPQKVRSLSRVDVLVINGLGFEFWTQKLLDNMAKPVVVVNTSKGILDSVKSGHHLDLIRGRGHTGDHQGHETYNPHIWLDPCLAIGQVKNICDGLSMADSSYQQQYQRNAQLYIEKLENLNNFIQNCVETWRYKKFISYHAAWVYFARRYGLDIAAVIHKAPGVDPSPRNLADILEIAEQAESKVIVAEPQMSLKTVNLIANETGISVVMLDPLGDEKNERYIELMKKNVNAMSFAFK
jgi:zinc transport system substrate-binding protein